MSKTKLNVMKRFSIYMLALTLLLLGACKRDFLEVSSPSAVDEKFVFSSPQEAYKVIMGEYELWRNANGGLFYDLDVVGSDAETHPESYDAQMRHIPEGLYASEMTIDYTNSVDTWADLYQIANRANMIMEAIAENSEYQAALKENQTTDWTHLYGEAAVFRAYAYFNLVRYFGDVPYFDIPITTLSQTDSAALTSRDYIYNQELAKLQKVQGLMHRLGEGGINAERFSRTFAQGLIGKIALFAGGYSLRRNDMDYGNVSLQQKGTDKWGAYYARRSDYKDYYQIANTALKELVDNPGSATLITTDPRGEGYNNPFQYNFQYNMNLQVSPESLYEVGETQGQASERPYAFGRPSNGGGANAYPCKSYGQSRMFPVFYYGDYDPTDLRRDVTATVTVNSGSASEVLVNFTPGSRNQGGISNNKWDESRMAVPFTAAQRKSGINWVQMRMADVILMLAETYAELGQEAAAKEQLTRVRSRAFNEQHRYTKVTSYIGSLSGEALKEAIQQERKLEFAGEGIRRYDLIRTGMFPERIKQVRDQQKEMVASLTSKGYYTFENGNTISNYIYVKAVNVTQLGISKMLTTQCNVLENDPSHPVRFPSWRGNCDLWTTQNFLPSDGNRNLAIKGLFEYIDPSGSEAAALVEQGYKKTEWAINIVNFKDQYTTNIFKGYTDAYYAAGVPPRYMLPLSSETILRSNGLIKNGYGFAQQ